MSSKVLYRYHAVLWIQLHWIWIRIQGNTINLRKEFKIIFFKTSIFSKNYKHTLSHKEVFYQLSLWIVNYYLKSDIFCLHLILYLHVWIRIRIRIPNTDPDPGSLWIRIQYGSWSTTLVLCWYWLIGIIQCPVISFLRLVRVFHDIEGKYVSSENCRVHWGFYCQTIFNFFFVFVPYRKHEKLTKLWHSCAELHYIKTFILKKLYTLIFIKFMNTLFVIKMSGN